jgi:hypothetical protein
LLKSLEEVPETFGIHKLPPRMKEPLKELLSRKGFTLVAKDDSLDFQDDTDRHMCPGPLQQGQIVTKRRMKRWLLQELKAADDDVIFQTASSVKLNPIFDPLATTVALTVIIWDTVQHCAETFVKDVVEDWRDATHFMVAVGCCKALAMSNPAVFW